MVFFIAYTVDSGTDNSRNYHRGYHDSRLHTKMEKIMEIKQMSFQDREMTSCKGKREEFLQNQLLLIAYQSSTSVFRNLKKFSKT